MPTRLDLDISAGSASPAPLELKSNLIFTQEPYALSKVSIQKGSIRQSLLQALSIPFAPLKEFEYSLSGEYSLTTPASAAFNIDVLKNVFEYGSNHDLKGTSLSSKLQLASDKISITDGKIAVLDNNATILSSALSGDVSLSPYKNPSTISVNASLANVDLIRTLLNEIQPPTTTSDSTNSAQPSSQSAPTSSSQASAPAIQMPVGSLDVRADKVIIQGIDTKSFTIAIKVPESRTIEKAALDAGFSQGGALSMNASGSFDKSLSFKASGKDVNMIPFAAAASGPKGEILEGSLKSLDVNISAEARDIRKTLQGHATVSFSRLIVPSTLQEQIPFNILFLPLDALITVFGGTLNMLLPASISSISDSIRQTLDDAGRLGIDNSIVDLGFDKGKILLKNVDINTKNLPDFTFKGSITSEDRLNLTVFIALLKLNLPLPIAGTMSTPLPDIMYLGPEIVRGLGLSVGSLAGSAASIFGGGSNKSETNQESPAALNR
jgi:Cu/Ag efflux protein CusF